MQDFNQKRPLCIKMNWLAGATEKRTNEVPPIYIRNDNYHKC